MEDMQAMAETVAKSGLFAVKTAEQALALMLLCDAEHIHPMTAMRRYHIIEGKPSMRADAMQAEFQRRGGTIKWLERDEVSCGAIFSHAVGGTLEVRWTMHDAQRAGLAGRPNWQKHPRQMLSARVISEGIRAVFPEVVAGIYTPEEVQDYDDAPRKNLAATGATEDAPRTGPSVATTVAPAPTKSTVIEAEVVQTPATQAEDESQERPEQFEGCVRSIRSADGKIKGAPVTFHSIEVMIEGGERNVYTTDANLLQIAKKADKEATNMVFTVKPGVREGSFELVGLEKGPQAVEYEETQQRISQIPTN